MTEEDLKQRGIDMHQFEELCRQRSPQGSEMMQVFTCITSLLSDQHGCR